MEATALTLEALYAAGHLLVERDRQREAVSLFRTMLLVDARDERGWLGLVACHEQLGEPEKALALSELAASACGPSARCAVARARLSRSLGSEHEAVEAYDEAARLAELADDHELATLIALEVRSS